jgi:hypothetical protein
MKSLPPLLLLMLMLGTMPARAAITGADLLARCTASEKSMAGATLTPEEMLDSSWCVGYLSGLLDGFGVGDFKVDNEKMVCPPDEGLSRTQALNIITRHLRDHPEDLPKSGRRDALLALAKALPCKRP